MQFNKDKLQLRLYQQAILNSALNKNTLVVLPTGLGKTHIAIALTALKINEGKVLIMAPTLPLVNQHKNTFAQFFSPAEEISVLCGKVNAEERIELWNKSKLIFATPQTIRFDVLAGRISLKDVSLIVFDEAHRAVGDYAYVFIGKAYAKQSKKPHVLALTASPGTQENVNEVCSNLLIEKVEVRSRESPDVAPYVKPIIIKYSLVDLPPIFLEIKKRIELAIESRLAELKRNGVWLDNQNKLTKSALLALNQTLKQQFLQDKRAGYALSLCNVLIKLVHAHSLLTTETLHALQKYFENLWTKSRQRKTKSLQSIVNDFHIKAAYTLVIKAIENELEHPKLDSLRAAIKAQLEEKRDSKILIFTEFRDNISPIIKALSEIEGLNVYKFIGQAARSEGGMPQRLQNEALERFRNNELNCLVCTSVGEEGIDMPNVDLVVFYSPLPSVIRTIQRRGRTGRTAIGKVLILAAKGTRDEAYYWASKKKEAVLNSTLKNLQQNVKQVSLESYPLESDEDITIFADSKESEIANLLHAKGVKVNLAALKSGDFILSEDVGCERKSVADFVNSLIDGRLFEQAKKLKSEFAKPFLILEGDFNLLFSIRNVSNSALLGSLASLIIDWGIPILFTKNKEETAELLYIVARREQIEKKKEVSVRKNCKPSTITDMQQFFIEGLPQIGPEIAKALLKYFGTPKNIINASVEELMKVEGIGEKKAKLIREILDTIYKE
jgi:Fanconi anemia group M protein